MEVRTSRHRSGSPGIKPLHALAASNTALSNIKYQKRPSQSSAPAATSPLVCQSYVSSGMQTDVENTDWFDSTTPLSLTRAPFMSLTKRLLLRCQKDRERLDAERSLAHVAPNNTHNNNIPLSLAKSQTPPISDATNSAPISISITEESEMKEFHPEPKSEPGGALSNLPVQKPRPPDLAPSILDSIASRDIKPPLPPPPLKMALFPSTTRCQTNGYHPPDLQIQLPPPPTPYQSYSELTSDSSVVLIPNSLPTGSPSHQTQNSHSSLSANASTLVHPSPKKKKYNLREYMNKFSNSKAESHSSLEKSAGASPVVQHNPIKLLGGPAVDSKVFPIEESTLVSTPIKEVDDLLIETKDPKS